MWGISSDGRAPALHAGGTGIDTQIHHIFFSFSCLFFFFACLNSFLISCADKVYRAIQVFSSPRYKCCLVFLSLALTLHLIANAPLSQSWILRSVCTGEHSKIAKGLLIPL